MVLSRAGVPPQREVFTHLPDALGYEHGPPVWSPLPALAVGGPARRTCDREWVTTSVAGVVPRLRSARLTLRFVLRMARENSTIMAVICLIIGAKLIGDAVSALAG